MLPAATRPPKRARSTLHVLEAVQQRHDDAVRDRARIDALDRVLERRRLHRHEQEVDGLRELLGDLDAGRQRPLGRLDDEPGERDQPDRLGVRDADDGHAGVRRAGRRASRRRRRGRGLPQCRSCLRGSTTRFTTFRSEYTSSASIPASRQPVPESLTPPKPMCGSEPCVPAVHDDDAGLHALGEAHRPVDARRVDRRGEPVRRVVDERDRLVEARRRGRGPSPARRARCARSRRREPTPSTTVGARYQPGRSRRSPPVSTVAPVLAARATALEDPLEALLADHRLRLERSRAPSTSRSRNSS